jgi:murein DD-endopeptidase MepM/ murein hydrolase activator NlpD
VVAARPGTVRHVNYGAAFGSHQVAVMAGDGTRDFYAHMSSRVGDGMKVKAGDRVGEVGAEGNATGPHLHFERHASHSAPWSCGVIRDPAPSIKWTDPQEDDMPLSDDDLEKIAKRVNQVLGDYTAAGDPRDGTEGDQADKRLRQIESVVRDIRDRVKRLEG